MLLLNLTLCCFQMCIPCNETQKCSQNDLYVLETIGGMETCLATRQYPPQGAMVVVGKQGALQRGHKRRGRAEEEPLAWQRGKQPEFKVIWETPAEGAAFTSTPSFNQHLSGACCVVDHRQLRKMNDMTDTV